MDSYRPIFAKQSALYIYDSQVLDLRKSKQASIPEHPPLAAGLHGNVCDDIDKGAPRARGFRNLQAGWC